MIVRNVGTFMGEDTPPATPDTPDSSGLTPQGASVLRSLFDSLSDIGSTLITTFGPQPTGQTPPPGSTATGSTPPQLIVAQPPRMDPVMLAAIGIPVALVAVALLKGKK